MADAPGTDRDDLIERLKAEAKANMERAAAAEAKSAQYEAIHKKYEARHRAELEGMQEEAKFFMSDFVASQPEYKQDAVWSSDIKDVEDWTGGFASKADLGAQTGLAKTMFVASKGVKRLRDQASRLPELEATMATTMKENEELKATNAKLIKESEENKVLLDERQAGMEKLQEALAKAGVVHEKFDFSKLASREKVPEPSAVAAEVPAVTQVTAQASRASGNPFENNNSNPLLASLLKNASAGSGRVMQSATGHAWVGSDGTAPTDLGAIISARS